MNYGLLTYDGSDELIGHTHLMSHLLVSLSVSPPVHMATTSISALFTFRRFVYNTWHIDYPVTH
jgi:hypothetical protein